MVMGGKNGLIFNPYSSDVSSEIHDVLDSLKGLDDVKSNISYPEIALKEVKPVSDV